MGLIKNLNNTARSAENIYWKISTINFSYEQKRATVTLAAYESKEASKSFDELNRPVRAIDQKIICIKDEDLFDKFFSIEALEKGTNPLKEFYNYLKEHEPFFANSIDN